MRLTIIIVNYCVKYYVEQCLRSIYRSEGIELSQLEVYIVDNCSRDGSVDYLKELVAQQGYPHVHFIANLRNVGFGRANNQAVAKARGRYVLFLNPDTVLTEHTLHDVLTLADERGDFGAIGVKMLQADGSFARESRRGTPTPWVSFCKMTGLTSLFPLSRAFGRYYLQYLPRTEVCEIDIVSGAFMCIPAEVLRKVGSFDEAFFMFGEDVDLSYRLLHGGHRNYYCPTSILHYKGESTKKNTYRYVHVFYEAMLIFFRKHYRHYHLLFSLPIQIAILLRAGIALLMQQLHHLHKFLHPVIAKPQETMIYIGHAMDKVRDLAERNGLNIDCYEGDALSLPDGHLSPSFPEGKYMHIIYDVSDYTYARLLAIFERHPQRDVYMGTFDPDRGLMVLANQVYESR